MNASLQKNLARQPTTKPTTLWPGSPFAGPPLPIQTSQSVHIPEKWLGCTQCSIFLQIAGCPTGPHATRAIVWVVMNTWNEQELQQGEERQKIHFYLSIDSRMDQVYQISKIKQGMHFYFSVNFVQK